jgi:Ca2+-binding RTX toxin-like protein
MWTPTVSLAGHGCTIIGTNDGEVLTGTLGRDVICARGGADRANGLGSKDIIRGGPGNDHLVDKAGRDTLNAKDGERGDVLVGGPRRDRAFKDRGDRARSI